MFLLVLAKFFLYWLAGFATLNLMMFIWVFFSSGFSLEGVKKEYAVNSQTEKNQQAYFAVQSFLVVVAFLIALFGLLRGL